MKRLPIPERFQQRAAMLGVSVRHFINDSAIRDDYLNLHEKGEIRLTKEEQAYLINILMGRQERLERKLKA